MSLEQILKELAERSLADFAQVAILAKRRIASEQIKIEILPAPHKPPSSLPKSSMAVYSFFFENRCLKVGKVGAKSQARYVSQHYIPASSMSNLAKSLVKSVEWADRHVLSEDRVGVWMKANTSRINYILPESFGLDVLSLLEAFLHCQWQPEFEGKSQ